MLLVIIEATDNYGDVYPPVAIHADTIQEAMVTYEDKWYPGMFTDPSMGIGEIKIKSVTSITMKAG
jgi:hypothetical protein